MVFLRVLSIVARPILVDCLLRGHHQDTTGDVTMGDSAFFAQIECIHAKSKLVFVSHLLDVSTFLRGGM